VVRAVAPYVVDGVGPIGDFRLDGPDRLVPEFWRLGEERVGFLEVDLFAGASHEVFDFLATLAGLDFL